MANTYKNIVITPNRDTDAANVPSIRFSGGDGTSNTDINVRVYTTQSGTLSFEGSAGQLFSVTNDLTGSIFSVNDVSGIPSIEVFANGQISFAPYGGNVVFGNTSSSLISNPYFNSDINFTNAGVTRFISTPANNSLTLRVGTVGQSGYGTRDMALSVAGGGYLRVDYSGGGTYQYDTYGSYWHMGYSGMIFNNGGGNASTYPVTFQGVNYVNATTSFRAPIFYDSDNTAYFMDLHNTSRLSGLQFANGATSGPYFYYGNNQQNLYLRGSSGSDIGVSFFDSSNTWRSQLYASASGYGFLASNWGLWDLQKVSGGRLYLNNQTTYYIDTNEIYYNRVYGVTDIRSPIFYDNNDTAYYTDPASTSVLNALTVGGNSVVTYGDATLMYRRGLITTENWNTFIDGSESGYWQVSNGSGLNKPSAYMYGTMVAWSSAGAAKLQLYAPHNGTESTGIFIRTGWDTDYDAWAEIAVSGKSFTNSVDLRAPIFYDSNNTAYYVDPASTSVLNSLTVEGSEVLTTNLNTVTGSGGWDLFGNAAYQKIYGDHSPFNNEAVANAAFYRGSTWTLYGWNGSVWTNLGTVASLTDGRLSIISLARAYSEFIIDIGTTLGYCFMSAITFTHSTNGNSFNFFFEKSTSATYNTGTWITMTSQTGVNSWPGGSSLKFSDVVGGAEPAYARIRIVPTWSHASNIIDFGGLTISSNYCSRNQLMTWDAAYGISTTGSFRAPIFYDTNNTAYYLDPASTSNLNTVIAADVRAPIFYDQNNTAYYTDPASTSILNGLTVAATITGSIQYVTAGQPPNTDSYMNFRVMRNNNSTAANDGMWIGYSNSNSGVTRIFGGGSAANEMTKYSDRTEEPGSFRAPIFYDVNNTGYYVDPAGATNLFNLYIQGGVANPIASAQYYDAAIEVREFAFGGAQTDSWSYAPRIGFHWSGRTAAQIGMSSGSRIHMLNSDASGYVQLQSGNFYSPIFYDSDNTNFYVDPAGTGTSLQIAGAIKQGNNIARPNIEWQAQGASTGMVIFSLPGASANYGMVHMVFDIYEYVAGKIATVIVGGHNWSGAWYQTGCQVIGNLDKTVRLGFKDGKYCVVFGGSASTWTYGTIRLRKIHNGGFYDNIMDLGGAYTAVQMTTESFTSVTGDLRYLITPGTFQAGNDVRAPIFYDSNNTAFYVDPASGSSIKRLFVDITNVDPTEVSGAALGNIYEPSTGWSAPGIAFGTGTGSHGAIGYNSGLMYFATENGSDNTLNSRMTLTNAGILTVNGDVRTPIFYDLDNTAYYTNPNSTSNLNALTVAGKLLANSGTNEMNGHHYWTAYNAAGNHYPHFNDGTDASGTKINWRLYLGATNSVTHTWTTAAATFVTSLVSSIDARAPTFYDSNDTSYYTNPASTSVLNVLTAANIIVTNLNASTIGWNSIVPVFGQRGMYLNELVDILYQADKRFTVTNGNAIYFDGDYNSGGTIPVSTTRVININIAGQAGIPANGITYCGGTILVSFYYTDNLYSSLSLRVRNYLGVWTSAAAPTNISTSAGLKVMSFTVPIGNYLTDIELTVVTDATNAVSLASINYYTDRWTTEIELPYASKYLSSNYMFGNFGVKNNVGGINNLLSGTASSYLSAIGGSVGIGNASPSYKLHVTGTAYASLDFRAPIFYDFDNTAYYLDPLSTSNLNTVQAADAFRSNRFEDLDGNFFFREGALSGVTRHLNLSDSDNDPSTMSSDVGISWGARSDNNPYYMIWTSNYNNGISTHSRLRLGWHTGIEIGASTTYGGVKFFDNSPGISTTEIMSIGKLDAHVRVINNLYSKIYYDIDNTTYYVDPATGTNLNGTLINNAGTAMTGGWNRSILLNAMFPVIVFNSNNTKYSGIGVDYSAVNSGFYFWVNGNSTDINNGSATIAMNIDTGNFVAAAGSFRAPIFYDSNNTAYYVDPNSTTNISALSTTSLGVGTAASGTAGEIRAANNITAYYSSDIRLKTNIKPIENSLFKLQQINGMTFDWTDEEIERRGGEDGYFVRKHDVGVIAQEVEIVLPEIVAERLDGYKAVKYEMIIPLLIEAIKELKAELDMIKEKIK